MAGLPEGFTIDQPQKSENGLPPGFTIDAPADMPDVGPPAITAGQQEFSPGMPAVNQEVERIAQSANRNLIEPIKDPLGTLGGIANVGAGLAQYAGQGALGTGFEPSVDALAADYAKTYGSLPGFKEALINDPVRVAMDASMGLGALRGIGRRAGVLSRPAAPIEAPSTEALREAADTHYNQMHGFGVELHPHVMDDAATNIMTELKTQGYRDYLAPKTFKAVEELRNPDGQFMTTQEVEGVRRALNKASMDPAERDAARRAIAEIDTTMAALKPADAAINGQFAPRVAQEARAARANYAAFKQAQQIDQATDRAGLQAASTGSGANIDNATRQKFRAILTNPKKLRGYSAEEQSAMRQLVQGTAGGNAARLIGKLAPSGIVSAALGAGLGEAVGHTVGVPALGLVAKKLSDMSTARKAAQLSELRRLRSPLARQIGAVPHPGYLPPVRGPLQLGRMAATPQLETQ